MKASSPISLFKRPYAIAAVMGTLLWTVTAVLADRREPWDSSAYWTVAYPLAVVFSGVLGYLFPQRPWRWAVVLIFMQLLVMIVGGSGFGLLPLGLILLGILSLPAIAVAVWAAKLRWRRGDV